MKKVRTLLLTTGSYAITSEVADRIVSAIRCAEQMVRVPIDLYCDGSNPTPVLIMLAHVVGIAEHEEDEMSEEIFENEKVRRLRA